MDWIVGAELDADAVDAVPLVRRGCVAFTLEDVAQMATAVGTDDLGADHAQGTVGVSRHRAGDGIEEGRPATARLELVAGFVERCSATGATVDARGRHVLIVLAGVRGFGALSPQHTELLCDVIELDQRDHSSIAREDEDSRAVRATGAPLLRTARHSSSLFIVGYDTMFRDDDEVPNSEPRKGSVGIDLTVCLESWLGRWPAVGSMVNGSLAAV